MNLRKILSISLLAMGMTHATLLPIEEVRFSTIINKKPHASFTFFKKALSAAQGTRAKFEVLKAMTWMYWHMNFSVTGSNPLVFKDAKGNTISISTSHTSHQFAVAAIQYPELLKILLELRDIHADIFEFNALAKVNYLQRAAKNY